MFGKTSYAGMAFLSKPPPLTESFLYPIYGGLILLAGLVVGCTVLILEEIQSLKEKIDDLSNK